MKFYLNNTEVKVEVAPIITETEDETLDSATVVLEANSQRLPYAPMQEFRVDFENDTDVLYFVIASDSVELFSLNPERYKHTLSLVQSSRTLSKHLVRNSVFTQPATKYKKSYWATTSSLSSSGLTQLTGCGGSHYSENLDSREKITNSYLEIDFCVSFATSTSLVYQYSNFNSVEELNIEVGATSSIYFEQQDIYINYTLNGTATSYKLQRSDVEGGVIKFNQKLECSKIKTLLEQGATDLYVSASEGVVKIIGDPTELTESPYYTNTRISTQVETYYYTCYDILELLQLRQLQEDGNYYQHRPNLFLLPTLLRKPELYTLLSNTIAPNFTFTQCSLYECVAEVFRLFDAIFVLDENNVLDIEYFNDNDRDVITETNNKLAGLNISISEDRYTNEIVAYYQDARQERTFPSKSSYAYARSNVLGVASSDDHNFIVDKPIYMIEKVEVYVESYGYGNLSITHTGLINNLIDITDYVKEESIYTLLPIYYSSQVSNFVDSSSFIQAASLHYSKGATYIPLGDETQRSIISYPNLTTLMQYAVKRFMGINDYVSFANLYGNKFEVDGLDGNDTPDWSKVRFRITYTTTLDGRTVVESINPKAEGQTLINQNNGAVDLNKMGLNMEGISLKTGEPTFNATMQLNSWSNRLKKGVIYKDSLNNKWVVNSVSYTIFDSNKIQAQISFAKNYNELSRRIRLEQEKRLSNISAELTQKSEDNLIEFVYFSSNSSSFTSYSYSTYINFSECFYAFRNTLGLGDSSDREIQYANIKSYDGSTLINTTYCPLVKYAAGNMLCFEISYDSSIIAGNKTKVESGWFGSNKYNTSAVKYANDYGFVDEVDIAFIPTYKAQTFTQNFPQIPNATSYDITGLKIYKQPNEIFALNYELAFIPFDQESDFIGQAFMQNNNLIIAKENCNKTFKLYYANDDFKYSVLDTKAHGTALDTTISLTQDTAKKMITITATITSSVIATNWAVADEDGNIYFSSNSSRTSNAFNMYFQFRKERL